MRIQIELAHGGDERVAPKSLLYIRQPTPREAENEPGTLGVLRLRGVQFLTSDSFTDLAEEFRAHIPLAALTTPSGHPIWVNLGSVVDWDPSPTSAHPDAKSWLVFGTGPRAPRLAVRETREELTQTWAALDQDDSIFG
jgi:hypothetical protein